MYRSVCPDVPLDTSVPYHTEPGSKCRYGTVRRTLHILINFLLKLEPMLITELLVVNLSTRARNLFTVGDAYADSDLQELTWMFQNLVGLVILFAAYIM